MRKMNITQQKSLFFLILFFGLITVITGCSKEVRNSKKALRKIENKVIKLSKEKEIPSIQVSITIGDISTDFNFNSKDAKLQSIYGIGSATKLLSSIFLFKLIEEDLLHLTDTITNYLTEEIHIINLESITVGKLLNHTSGISDYSQNSDWIKNVVEGNGPDSFEEKVILIDSNLTNSGSFNYSNSNYLFLEKVVESITNKPFDIAFNEFYSGIGFPITLDHSGAGLESYFGQSLDNVTSSSNWKEYHGFAGEAHTTMYVLNELLKDLFVEKSILKETSLSQMQDWENMNPFNIPIGEGTISQYGYGIMNLNYKGRAYIGHFGGTLSYQSFIFFSTEDQISIAISTNCAGNYYNNVFFQEIIPTILNEL